MPKTNPRRRPATQADVERAKKNAQGEAISLAMTIMFTALLGQGGVHSGGPAAAVARGQ